MTLSRVACFIPLAPTGNGKGRERIWKSSSSLLTRDNSSNKVTRVLTGAYKYLQIEFAK